MTLGYTGVGVNVCMLDDGFNWYRKHEALKNIPVAGGRTRDFIRGILSVQDTTPGNASSFSHGTMTLSALAGRKDGVYLSPGYGCNIILGRTEYDPSEKPIEMVYWAQGAEWADSLGADIISTSLGYNLFPDSVGTDITYPMLDGHTTIITRAAEIAAAKGILVVVSAGNDGTNAAVGRKISAPADANGDSVIAIAALDSLGVRASFSSKGPSYDNRIKPDLAAQGVSVLLASTTGNPNTYSRASGTSFSCPLVAGVAACLIQARPTWPPTLIIQALKRTASNTATPDTLIGWVSPTGSRRCVIVPTRSVRRVVRGRSRSRSRGQSDVAGSVGACALRTRDRTAGEPLPPARVRRRGSRRARSRRGARHPGRDRRSVVVG
jgi:subtilisin family serine protease